MARKDEPGKLMRYDQLICPRSFSQVNGQRMKRHPLTVRLCRGEKKALFVYCNVHGFRGFCTDPEEYKRCIDAQAQQAASVPGE